MDGIILLLGGSLVVVNGISSGQLKDLWGIIGDNSKPYATTDHTHMVLLMGEFLFVFILAMLAGTSKDAGKAIIALLVALWLVYIMVNNVKVAGWLNTFTAATQNK